MKKRLLGVLAAAGILSLAAFFAAPTQAATSKLYLTQSCLADGSVRVNFQWEPNTAAHQRWLDLSLFNNNWEWGTFLGAGPMSGSETRLTWDGLIPNATHYVRVNQLLPGGWDPSPTFYFHTPDCKPSTPAPGHLRERVEAPIDKTEVVKITDAIYLLRIQAGLPGGCAAADGYTATQNGTNFEVKVYNTMPTDNRPCTLIYGWYDVTVNLGDLEEGTEYRIRVNDEVVRYTP